MSGWQCLNDWLRDGVLHETEVPSPGRPAAVAGHPAAFRQEPLLNRACAIRFVVGVNGTGKTRLLVALAEVFLHLERGNVPPFPVTLAYDIGTGSDARTVLLHSPNGGPTSAVFKEVAQVIEDRTEEDWEALASIEPVTVSAVASDTWHTLHQR